MSNYPSNFRGTNFDHAEAAWTFREDYAMRDVEKLIAEYTDADLLNWNNDEGLFLKICTDNNADAALCAPEIEKAVRTRMQSLSAYVGEAA